LQIDEREVLRIFCMDFKNITLFSFFNNNLVTKSVHEEYYTRHFILSEDSDEVAAISSWNDLTILKINEKHEFYVSGTKMYG
jgi:hypothetical protein